MKKKEKTALHTATSAQLEKAIAEAQGKLAQLSVNRYSKQSKNVREARGLRRDIAIRKSILRQKELHHE
jgi:ribosomal protein L29